MQEVGVLKQPYMKKKVALKDKSALDFFIDVFCFLSVLLIGADKWGINVGVNLRFDQILLVILAVLLCVKNGVYFTRNRYMLAFVILSFISTILCSNLIRGAAFFCSILYNVIFIFYCFESYVRNFGLKRFIRLFRISMFVITFLLLCQFALKVFGKIELSFLPSYGEYMGIPRFSLWFYEPSYLATYMVFWLGLSGYMLAIDKDLSFIKDILCCLVITLVTTSSTAFLGIFLVLILVYVMWFLRKVSIKKIVALFVIIGLLFALRYIFSDIYDVFVKRLFEGDLDGASGGRISRWSETWQVFCEHPFFGVGPGNYGTYLGQEPGYVPSNVTLDMMATLGIFATVIFYTYTVVISVKGIKRGGELKNKTGALLVACVLGLLVFTVILQANQGYLRLYHWMFLGIVSGGIKYGSTLLTNG